MSTDWDEYLDQVGAYLDAARRSVERGETPPAPPERPEGPGPDGRAREAQMLALGCEQLALEVGTRLEALRENFAARPPSPYGPRPGARFHEASA